MNQNDFGFHSAHSAALLLSIIWGNSNEGLFNKKTSVSIDIPVAVGIESSLAISYLGALSVELGIKALLMKVGLEVLKTHDLLELFEKLPVALRDEITEGVCKNEGYSAEKFDAVLKINRDVFTAWRYFHELSPPSSADPGFLIALATVIRNSNSKEGN
jgi:hypothetical protein